MARSGGTEAVVLREATRRAGVSPNAAYRHFANREALLDEVGLAAADQIGVVMREAVAEASPSTMRAWQFPNSWLPAVHILISL